MPRSHSSMLRLSRAVIRALILANLLLGAAILALLIASLLAETAVMTALGASPANAPLVGGMRLIMMEGICSAPLTHVVLTRLLAVLDTVGLGNPFQSANVGRLQTIAWALLGLESLHLAAGAVAALSSTRAAPLDIDWSFSVTGWLAVLLLFVLARVFDEGARMNRDLQGTV